MKKLGSYFAVGLLGSHAAWAAPSVSDLAWLTGVWQGESDGQWMDGPFVETQESIGGYYLIEARSLAAATELAKECPILRDQGRYVEVREVEI